MSVCLFKSRLREIDPILNFSPQIVTVVVYHEIAINVMLNANIHFPPVVLLLIIRGVAAAEDSSEFTLNLFTDIAP
jgi:hypothetical protein